MSSAGFMVSVTICARPVPHSAGVSIFFVDS
jgi:hypothetical protein